MAHTLVRVNGRAAFDAIDATSGRARRGTSRALKRGVEQPAVRQELMRDVLHRLEALGLIESRSGKIMPLPAIARYALKDNP